MAILISRFKNIVLMETGVHIHKPKNIKELKTFCMKEYVCQCFAEKNTVLILKKSFKKVVKNK